MNMKRKKNTTINKIFKIPYFDEEAAQDYLDVKNGGRLDWSTDENKEKLARIVGEIEAEVGGGVNLLVLLKAAFQSKGDMGYSSTLSKVIDSRLKNTLLTDYLNTANKDDAVIKFVGVQVSPYPNSFTMYKMFSSYLTVVPQDKMPIDMEKLNQAILGERGYYELVAEKDNKKCILRFNINAFRNGYHLTDLSKMNLIYYGIPVGKLLLDKLEIGKEFDYVIKSEKVSAEAVLGEDEAVEVEDNTCEVYDIIIAGVACE